MPRNWLVGIGIVLVVAVIYVNGHHHGGNSSSNAAAAQSAGSAMKVSKCQVGGRTVLTGIPSTATQFRFVFMGGGFTGHKWHTDWLPNDSQVKGGSYWIDTLGDYGTTATGVTGEAQMSDGSTVETDLQVCY